MSYAPQFVNIPELGEEVVRWDLFNENVKSSNSLATSIEDEKYKICTGPFEYTLLCLSGKKSGLQISLTKDLQGDIIGGNGGQLVSEIEHILMLKPKKQSISNFPTIPPKWFPSDINSYAPPAQRSSLALPNSQFTLSNIYATTEIATTNSNTHKLGEFLSPTVEALHTDGDNLESFETGLQKHSFDKVSIFLGEEFVSKRHAWIRYSKKTCSYTLSDMSSMYGTWIKLACFRPLQIFANQDICFTGTALQLHTSFSSPLPAKEAFTTYLTVFKVPHLTQLLITHLNLHTPFLEAFQNHYISHRNSINRLINLRDQLNLLHAYKHIHHFLPSHLKSKPLLLINTHTGQRFAQINWLGTTLYTDDTSARSKQEIAENHIESLVSHVLNMNKDPLGSTIENKGDKKSPYSSLVLPPPSSVSNTASRSSLNSLQHDLLRSTLPTRLDHSPSDLSYMSLQTSASKNYSPSKSNENFYNNFVEQKNQKCLLMDGQINIKCQYKCGNYYLTMEETNDNNLSYNLPSQSTHHQLPQSSKKNSSFFSKINKKDFNSPKTECWLRIPPAESYTLHGDDIIRLGDVDFQILRFSVGMAQDRGKRPSMEDNDTHILDFFLGHNEIIHDSEEDRIYKQKLEIFSEQLQMHENYNTLPKDQPNSSQSCPLCTIILKNRHISNILKEIISLNHSYTPLQTSFFGVYDGHGGSTCSQYLHTFLHQSFKSHLALLTRSFSSITYKSVYKALHNAFIDTDNHFLIEHPNDSSGSTAVVVFILQNTLWCANSGDARAVLSRHGSPILLSEDHKPYRLDELTRIHKAGGFVQDRRVLGRLAVSRAFGDAELKVKLPEKFHRFRPIPRYTMLKESNDMIALSPESIELFLNDSHTDYREIKEKHNQETHIIDNLSTLHDINSLTYDSVLGLHSEEYENKRDHIEWTKTKSKYLYDPLHLEEGNTDVQVPLLGPESTGKYANQLSSNNPITGLNKNNLNQKKPEDYTLRSSGNVEKSSEIKHLVDERKTGIMRIFRRSIINLMFINKLRSPKDEQEITYKESRDDSTQYINLDTSKMLKSDGTLIIAEPEIRFTHLTEADEFILLACDGLFDVFTPQEAIDFVRSRLTHYQNNKTANYQKQKFTSIDPTIVAEELVKEAIEVRQSKDNVTAIIILLVLPPYTSSPHISTHPA